MDMLSQARSPPNTTQCPSQLAVYHLLEFNEETTNSELV